MKNLGVIALVSILGVSARSQSTFTTVYNIFQSKCVSCHGGASPAAGLNLSGTETQVYNAIVEVDPANTTAAAKLDKLIDKGYPERSFLLRKVAYGLSDDLQLTTGEGSNEPNGQAKLEDHEIELIRQWIIYGAPQSGNVVSYQRLIDYYNPAIGGRPKIARPAPPPAGQGFQIHFGPVFWAGGQETEYFKKYDPRFTQNIEATRFDLYMNSESHHFILRKFNPNDAQSAPDGLQPFNTDGFGRNFVNAWQNNAELELPAGTGFFWDNSTVFDLNFHMKNYHQNEILPGEVYLNVWSRPRTASTVEMHAELIPNLYIFIPNNNQPTTFSDDVRRTGQTWNIWMLSTHTHKYGIDYDIFLRNSNGSQGTQLYEGHYDFDYTFNQGYYDWSHPPVKFFNPMLAVNMSNGLIHKATYKNNGPNSVTWGFTTDGEMMLIYVQYTTQSVNYKPPIHSSSSGTACNSVTLSTDGGMRAYRWSNGDTTRTITVTQSGTYTVTVTDGSGTTYTSDPISVSIINASVSINNGSDPAICSGRSAVLDAGIASLYAWSTGATASSISVNTPGTYSVTITDANGCTASDVAVVTAAPNPVINLNDASFCSGQSATLDAGNAGAAYLWSTNETTQTITVSTTGNYYVTVTDASGCTASDVAAVTAHPLPVVNIRDVSVCPGSHASLDAGNPGSSYLWSTGETTQSIIISQAGAYSVTVTDIYGCSKSAQAVLTYGTNLSVNIPDVNVCEGESIVLDAGFAGASYLLSTGETTQTITVSTANTYSVTVNDPNGCNGSDSGMVTVLPKPLADAGESKTICEGETATLTATGGVSYLWTTGDATSTITVSEAGSYHVTVTAANGCQSTDKADVTLSLVLTGNISGNDIAALNETLPYSVNDNAGSSYEWQVVNGTVGTGQGSATVEIRWTSIGTGVITVIETNADGCTGDAVSKQVNVGATGTARMDNRGLGIYPNPASSFMKIEFSNPDGHSYQLNILDIAGKTVKSIPSVSGEEVIISRDNLPEGIYIIELKSRNTMRQKVVIAD